MLIIYGEKNVILNANKGGLAAVILFICRLERFVEIIFFTFSTQLLTLNYLLYSPTDAAPQFL